MHFQGQTCVEIVDPKIATFLKEAAMTARRKGLMVDNTRARTGSFKRPQPNPTGENQMPTYVNGKVIYIYIYTYIFTCFLKIMLNFRIRLMNINQLGNINA